MNTTLLRLLKGFTSINLEELESSASFMTRIDTKYLLHAKDINQVIEQFKTKYFILSIQGHYMFKYDNVYMDTNHYDLYYHHEKGMEKRIKVRTRYYVESDLAFFEFKQKEGDVTRKFRYKIDSSHRHQMTDNDQRFYASIYQSIDTKAPKHVLHPSLVVSFQRVTIVSKKNDERLTIDFNLTFSDPRHPKKNPIKLDNVIIVESKSSSTKTYSHKLMRKYGIRPAKGCSKYGFGLIMYKNVTSRNHFTDSLTTIKTITKDQTTHGLKSPSLSLTPKIKKKVAKQHTKTQSQIQKKLKTIKNEVKPQKLTPNKKKTTATIKQPTSSKSTKTPTPPTPQAKNKLPKSSSKTSK